MRLTTLFRSVAVLNVLAMVFQALFAGEILSGGALGLSLHRATARFLVLLSCFQLGVAVAMARKGLCPRWLLRAVIGMLAAEVLEYGLGEYHSLLFHVPIALAIFGGAVRQMLWAMESRGARVEAA